MVLAVFLILYLWLEGLLLCVVFGSLLGQRSIMIMQVPFHCIIATDITVLEFSKI